MSTEKGKERYVEIFFLKSGKKNYISRKEMPKKDFDSSKLKEEVCGYRFYSRKTKNGIPEGPKERVNKFICINSSSISSKEELMEKPGYSKLIKSMGNDYTHAIRFNKRIYLIDLRA